MRRRRGPALVAAALVLGALLVTQLLRRAERSESLPVGATPDAGAQSGAMPGALDPAPARADGSQAAPDERVALESRGSETSAVEGIRVRVVRADDRMPVPGAEVLYFDSGLVDQLDYREFAASRSGDTKAMAERFGRRFNADGTGLAVVPFPLDWGSVGVVHEGTWAEERIELLTEEVVLELRPDRALGVRLVDAMRAPVAGVIVELRQRVAESQYVSHAFQPTDGEGRARLEHLHEMRSEVNGIALEYFLGADVMAAEPVQVAIDPAHWPSEDVVLQLPGTGALVVELVGPGGEPWNGDGQVEIGLDRSTVASIRAAGNDIPTSSALRPIRAGRARFERLGLGLELELFVDPDGWKQHLATVSGPTRAGESVTARVHLVEPAPSISGRIVDREGRPLARESLTCEIWSQREPQLRVEQRRSDDSGRFVGFGGPYMLDDGVWSLYFSIPGEPQRAATTTLTAPVAAGPIELGDVVLDAPPLLARGVVTDASGRPVRAAKLLFEDWTEVPWQPGTFDWSPLPRGELASAPNGAFELRGWPRGERLRLSVRRPGYEPFEPLVFAPPADDLRILLGSEGAIAGRIVGSGERTRSTLNLSVRDERGGPGGRGVDWRADGAFRIGGLHSGTYALELRQWNHYPGSHAWSGIAVRSGETTDVGTIDLDQLMTVLRFEVLDQGGAPIPEARFGWPIPGFERLLELHLEKDTSGAHLLPTLELPLGRVEISAPGYRKVTLENVSSGQRIELERGPRLELVLSGGLPALCPYRSLWARLAEGDSEVRAVFDARGRTSLHFGGSGRVHVGLGLQDLGETGFASLEGLDWWIDVANSTAGQTFVSPAPTAEFLDNLERLLRR